jgi:hypothetical protein
VKPHIALRIGAVITGLLFVGHMLGMPWVPEHAPRGAALVAEMKAYRFDVMGFTRGYWDFYQGFGVIIGATLAGYSVQMWQLASRARASPAGTRPAIVVLLAVFIAFAALDWVYLFTAPLVMSMAVAACLAWAWAGTGSPAS